MTGPREGPSPRSINTGPEAGPVVTPLRKRIEELTSELYESQRRLSNSDNERLLLKKTLNESERRGSDLMESAKMAEQKVRERADSYYQARLYELSRTCVRLLHQPLRTSSHDQS